MKNKLALFTAIMLMILIILLLSIPVHRNIAPPGLAEKVGVSPVETMSVTHIEAAEQDE